MKVPDLDTEEESANEAQYRISQVPVQSRHRARCDPALKPVAHHQVSAAPESLDERHQGGEVIAVIGVAHDHITSASFGDPAPQCISVTTVSDSDDPGSGLAGQLLAAVGAAIIGYDDFAADVVFSQKSPCPPDTGGNGLSLIEARHQQRHFHLVSARHCPFNTFPAPACDALRFPNLRCGKRDYQPWLRSYQRIQ